MAIEERTRLLGNVQDGGGAVVGKSGKAEAETAATVTAAGIFAAVVPLLGS